MLAGLCCWLAFGIVPAMQELRRGIAAEREALAGSIAERNRFDAMTRDAQTWIVNQQAEQIKQVEQLKKLLAEMPR